MLSHAAGTADHGTFIVSEVWSSREDQAAWEQKLAPALAANGVTSFRGALGAADRPPPGLSSIAMPGPLE